MNKEEKLMLLRIIVSAILLSLVLVFPLSIKVKFIISVLSYLIIGFDVLWKSLKKISQSELFNEYFLMSIATIGALIIGEAPEAVAVMLFYQTGELFQDIAVGKSRQSIVSLMDIRPDYAWIAENGEAIQVNPETVEKGSLILVKAGEKIPLDGYITEGSSSLNTVALTGESLPRDVKVGDNVISGSINMTGLLQIQTTSNFSESTVSKILDLVEKSDTKKAETEKFIRKFAKIYTPIIVIIAVLLALIPSLITGDWLTWVNRALILLVISCPCALVVSVPLTFFSGIGAASKVGILVKGSNYLEILANSKILVFDKTGTLTKGNFNVVAVHPKLANESQLLEIATLAESYSTHPIAQSLSSLYNKKIDQSRVKDVENFSGEGIKALVDNQLIYVGNHKLMSRISVNYEACEISGTMIHIAREDTYLGHIVIADEIKEEAAEAIQSLKKLSVRKIVMLTGDRKHVAESVANSLGLDEVHAELLPEDKVEKLEVLLSEKKENEKLAFVGDGINDAPVLKRANLGIAMGALGSDAAIEAADVVLMDDNPKKISQAIKISRKTLRIVKQNIIFALSVKIVFLILASFGIATMWEGVFADVGVSFLAILNALRAMKNK
ncbi:MAG: heavy metal translocating P-type ATPase [Lactovum sp.]